MTIVRKPNTPQDLLRLIPALLGYQPADSFVLLPMVGGRSTGVMRMDLPTGSDITQEAARTAVTLVRRIEGIDAVILITYGPRNQTLHDWMSSGLGVHGLGLTASLAVTEVGWESYLDDQVGTLESIAPEEIPGSPIGSADIPPLECRTGWENVTASEIPDEVLSVLDAAEVYIERDRELQYVSVSGFMTILSRPALRDVFLVGVVSGEEKREEALAAQLAWEDGAAYPQHLAMVMWGQGAHPDPARLERALKIARTVLSIRPEAGAYATAAWLSWALGRSTHADQYATRGLEVEPGHGLCEIVQSFITAGHLPDWAFNRGH